MSSAASLNGEGPSSRPIGTAPRNGHEGRLDAHNAVSHITLSDVTSAIKALDRQAFPNMLASEKASQSARKIARVADIVDQSVVASSRPSRFSNLSGIGQLHRERARRRTRQSITSSRDRLARVNADRSSTFKPLSLSQLLERLATFSISTYTNKPEHAKLVSPLGLAMNGWSHGNGQARDEVQCRTCEAEWKVEAIEQTAESWSAVQAKVKEEHGQWCPWRLQSCSASLYRVPIHSILEVQTEISMIASELSTCPGIDSIAITSSLPGELNSAQLSAKIPSASIKTIVLALFGWRLEKGEPKPMKECIVTCAMCARREGLWSYVDDGTSKRSFDPVRGHKTYCPVINGYVQSGKWLQQVHVDASADSSPAPAPAWQIKMQLLAQSGTGKPSRSAGEMNGDTSAAASNEVRSMRSAELVGKVKRILEGIPL